ncbi:MAG: hypothetical protein M5R38_04485 [Candidatus Methylomirabilis sp.]|nr:hypothetical protein [Candidatus Methylomirabilis sp.]
MGTRDSKYAARFFLGIITLGISEAGIQHEQAIEAMEGWRFCPPPRPVAWQGPPATAGIPRTPGTVVNATKWTVNVYLDPASPGVPPLVTLRPGEARQLALVAGPHRVVATPTAAAGYRPRATSGRFRSTREIEAFDFSFRRRLSVGAGQPDKTGARPSVVSRRLSRCKGANMKYRRLIPAIVAEALILLLLIAAPADLAQAGARGGGGGSGGEAAPVALEVAPLSGAVGAAARLAAALEGA